MSSAEITRKIESELGLSGMYNKVRWYIYKQKKNGVNFEQLSYLPPEEQKEPKRVVIQNQEPKHYEGKWDGTQTLRFGLMGDTQFGSKYAQISHLHNFYDLCEREGIVDIYRPKGISFHDLFRIAHMRTQSRNMQHRHDITAFFGVLSQGKAALTV
jgi:hypothetical protein